MFNMNIFKKSASPKKTVKTEKKTNPEPQPTRCHFQHQNGRRCRLPIANPSTPFCGTHRDMLELAKTKEDREAEAAAITAEVYGPVKSLDSAVAITHVLGNLFRLTLEGRIPQRKAATLTSQCRALLKAIESAQHEIQEARLFPESHPEILNLLAVLNGEEESRNTEESAEFGDATNRKPVAPNSSSASFPTSNSTSRPNPPVKVGAPSADFVGALAAPAASPIRAAEQPPQLQPASQTTSNVSSRPTDGITWIGHNLFNPNQSSTAFFRQTPSISADPNPAANSHDDANPSQ